jgi:hypothetical protein
LDQILNNRQLTLESSQVERSLTRSVSGFLVSPLLQEELHYRQKTGRSCHEERSYAIHLRGLVHISSCPNQPLNFGQITPHDWKKERTFDDLALRIHTAAVDFVLLPIASLALCVAICCILAPSAILHRGCTGMVAAVTCPQHVLKPHKYLAANIRCNLLVNMQLNAISSVGGKNFNASEFSVVCCIIESLKAHKVVNLEADHTAMLLNYR